MSEFNKEEEPKVVAKAADDDDDDDGGDEPVVVNYNLSIYTLLLKERKKLFLIIFVMSVLVRFHLGGRIHCSVYSRRSSRSR